MNWITNYVRPKINSMLGRRDIPENLWVKDPETGETSEECKKIRTRAETASADDNRICGKALAVANSFIAK